MLPNTIVINDNCFEIIDQSQEHLCNIASKFMVNFFLCMNNLVIAEDVKKELFYKSKKALENKIFYNAEYELNISIVKKYLSHHGDYTLYISVDKRYINAVKEILCAM